MLVSLVVGEVVVAELEGEVGIGQVFGASVAPARSIITPALTGPSRDRQRNRL